MTYEEIKEFVTNNPNITAEEFGKKLKQNGTKDRNICDLFMDIIRSGKSDTLNDRDTFLKTVELLVKSNIKIDIGDTASKTVLDYAVIGGQPDVIKIFLDSGKFDQERKLNALSLAINEGKVQEFEVFLDYVDHASIQGHLNAAPCNENTSIMKVLLDNKKFTEGEKVDDLSNASIDDDLPKVRLLLKHMTGIPEDNIRNLLKIIEERKLSLGEELKIDSEFKVDFNNSDHGKYLLSCVIIALLRSATNKKQNTPDGAESNVSNTSTGLTLNNDNIRNLCLDIDRITKQDSTVTSFEDLQKRLKKKEIDLQNKHKQSAVLEYAIKNQNLDVIKFLLQNKVTIISATGQEGRYYVSKIKESKSILCSVVSDTNHNNAEVLSTLLQSVNTEQSKLNPEDKLHRLYQQLKDDALCTAFAEKNSIAATTLIQNDRGIIVPHGSATNKEQETSHIETNSVSNSNRNVISRPVATVPPVSTNDNNHNNKNEAPVSTRTGPTAIPKANDFIDAQFSRPNEKGTKYKESKESFYTSLRSDVVGVVITGLFIAAAVMVPSVTGAVVCGVVAVLVAVATGLHVKNFTLPSYRAMEENKIEFISLKSQEL